MSADTSFVLALAPVSRGLGVFVIDTTGRSIDWRVREIRGFHKNARAQAFADELIDEFRPVALVIEDHRATGARRSHRISVLLDLIAELGAERGLQVSRHGLKDVRVHLDLAPRANKDDIAAAVAKRLPVLAPRLPKRKRIWETEAHVMAIFTAAGLALTHLGCAPGAEDGAPEACLPEPPSHPCEEGGEDTQAGPA